MDQTTVASEDPSVREGGAGPHAVTIRILSPSFDPNYFVSLDNIPLSSTVRQLKDRITSLVAGQPTATQQRLIYRGRPLLNDNTLLQDILEPSQDSLHSLHLVLPPRHVSSGTASAPAGTSSAINIPSTAPGSTAHLSNINLTNPQTYTQNTSNLRLRTPLNQIPSNSASSPPVRADATVSQRQLTHAQALANYQRQLAEHANAGRVLLRRAREIHGNFAAEGIPQTSISGNQPRPSEPQQQPFNPSVPPFSTEAQPIQTRWGRNPSPLQSSLPHTLGPQTIPGLTGPATTTSVNVTFSSSESTIQILMMNRLHAQVIALELDIERGIAPPVEIISTVRNQLYSILDGRYRNPGAPGGLEVETLLLRLHNIYTRAYQIRLNQIREGPRRPFESTRPVPSHEHRHVYLLSSPTGYQAVLASPNVDFRPPPLSTLPPFPQQAPVVAGPGAPVPPENLQHPVQPAMENIVRQAILNQAGQEVQPDAFARNVRRMWLFIRLYFFCYLFSDSGTWSRLFFVSMAVVLALLSETGLPGRIHQAIIDPIQRHLEGLIHGGERQTHAGGNTQNEANEAVRVDGNGHAHRGLFPNGMQHGLRTVERSIALFIASLVPGVGERQVEVRNAAAEAARNAERAREEEQQNQNDAANAELPNSAAESAAAIQNEGTTSVIPENERAGQQ